jgi:dienelactone hydrolase
MTQTDVFTGLACPREGFYTSEVFTPGGPRPVHTFLPVGYEPNYPYPLLVFLHGHGGNEEQILRLAPRLSRRNYLCIALRGPRAVGRRAGHPGFTWSVAPTSRTTSSPPWSRPAGSTTSTPSAST